MTLDEIEALHRLQNEFEKDPQNVERAYELFTVSLMWFIDLGIKQAWQVQHGHKTLW